MKDVIDAHTHTIASGHAYSTMSEMIRAAQAKNLEVLALTEHSIAMPGTCHEYYFTNYRVIPRFYGNLELMMGAELNIIDSNGTIDLPKEYLPGLDIGIASIHTMCLPVGDIDYNTAAYVNAMENPYVDIIGHPDDARVPVDYEKIVLAAKKHKKLIEVNNSSVSAKSGRVGARDNYTTILQLCKKYEVSVIMDSDAHIDVSVGDHEAIKKVLSEENFPCELVVNRSTAEFKKFLHKYK